MCKHTRAAATKNSNDFDSQQLRFMMERMIVEARTPIVMHHVQNDEVTYNKLENSTDVRHHPLPELRRAEVRRSNSDFYDPSTPIDFNYAITFRSLGVE
jgi:hypothetical protein